LSPKLKKTFSKNISTDVFFVCLKIYSSVKGFLMLCCHFKDYFNPRSRIRLQPFPEIARMAPQQLKFSVWLHLKSLLFNHKVHVIKEADLVATYPQTYWLNLYIRGQPSQFVKNPSAFQRCKSNLNGLTTQIGWYVPSTILSGALPFEEWMCHFAFEVE
jgi:hypothetical protein